MQVQVLSSVPNELETVLKHIKFGTSGHRGIISSTFTANHIRAIITAISIYLKQYKQIKSPRVLIGYDTRTGNSPLLEKSSYTYAVVECFIYHGINVGFCESFSPTPLVSWAIQKHAYDLGVILTASHNPPNYNGIKINDHHGAPASSDITEWIESEANAIFPTLSPDMFTHSIASVSYVNYTNEFISHLNTLLQQTFQLPFPSFSDRYLIDPKSGSSIEIWKAITADAIGTIDWHNDIASSNFNFQSPDPTHKNAINLLRSHCKNNACIGFSNDPDADRHVLIDEHGKFISPEKIAAIIIEYCISEGIEISGIATTLANSSLIKKISSAHHIMCHETNIGFKYFTPFLTQARTQNKLCIGVESSGGFSISLHTFDKCGFLPILLILGIMKKTNTPLYELASTIDQTYLTFHFFEDSIETISSVDLKDLMLNTQDKLRKLFEFPIDSINQRDGLKITFSNQDWVLCRPSGTEPVIRIYAESTTIESAKHYVQHVKEYLSEIISERPL